MTRLWFKSSIALSETGPMAAANPLYWFRILGSCNGLAFIDVDDDDDAFFLFNPTTRESKRIPDLGGEEKEEFLVSFYGFGYDEVHDDYKVVKLCTDPKTGVIYSARNDAWKTVVHGYDDTSCFEQMGFFLDGALHWVFRCKDEMGGSKTMVVVLDLATETFWDMSAPDGVDGGYDYSTGALNGCLCLHHIHNGMQDHFWVMNEYGVSESWTKVTISISYICMSPLCIATTGKCSFCLMETWCCTIMEIKAAGNWSFLAFETGVVLKRTCMWRASFHLMAICGAILTKCRCNTISSFLFSL